MARFKFVLSIENARTLDYVTEKFWQPLFAGTYYSPAPRGRCVRPRAPVVSRRLTRLARLRARVRRRPEHQRHRAARLVHQRQQLDVG